MSRAFPPRFLRKSFRGPRLAGCRNAGDAFQQLVGDGLKQRFGIHAYTYETLGRDGGVDAWIDLPSDAVAPVLGVHGPVIVECKHHGREGNALAGWIRVERKLREQAERGWEGPYQPWRRANGYLYCVSANLANQAARDKLTRRMEAFFQALPTPAPIQPRVLDWSDLRAWLDGLPTVADQWLGTGYSTLREHQSFVDDLGREPRSDGDDLGSARRLLRSDTLPFVPPPPDAPYHPARILAALRECMRSGKTPGVLLVGAGGVGKTRTLMEVAALAIERHGWRVLHAEPLVKTEDLAGVLAQASVPTLILLDHLDHMQGVAPRIFLDEVARRKKGNVVVLATARPGMILVVRTPWEEHFRKIVLDPAPEQRTRIVDEIVAMRAPTACAELGHPRVAQLCGRNPIIALLIADQLEERAQRGDLSEDSGPELNDGDLAWWLWERLREDRLSPGAPTRGSQWNTVEPEKAAFAAMLACAPQREARLEAAGARAIARLLGNDAPSPADAGEAAGGLALLRRLGWVEPRGQDTAAVHDVVADAVLERVLLVNGEVRVRPLLAVLAPGEDDLQHLRILLRSLARLRSTLRGHASRDALEAELAKWLRGQAAGLGRMLAANGHAPAFHVLASLARDRCLGEVLRERWRELAQPLLEARPHDPRAVVFIQEGLSASAGDADDPYIPLALAWLERHHARREAIMLIMPLIARKELQSAGTARLALDFANRHADSAKTSGIVFYRLLKGDGLVPDEVLEDAALAWVKRHRARFDSQYVLTALLRRKRWVRVRAIESAAEGWLRAFGKELKADHVLRALLLHYADQSLPAAVEEPLAAWLSHWAGHARAGEIFALLKRIALRHPARIVGSLLPWIAQFGVAPAKYLAVYRLLSNAFDAHANARSAAEGWLERNGHTVQAHVVLHALFPPDRRFDSTAMLHHAINWVVRFPGRAEAGNVLIALARHGRLPDPGAIEEIALAWLGTHGDADPAPTLLYHGLRRADLAFPERWERLAAAWAAERAESPNIGQVLRALLKRPSPHPAALEQTVAAALHWLERFGGEEIASGVLGPVLKRAELTPGERRAALETAFAYLDRHGAGPNGCHVLEGLFRRGGDLSAEARSATCRYANRWRENNAGSADRRSFEKEYRQFLEKGSSTAAPR